MSLKIKLLFLLLIYSSTWALPPETPTLHLKSSGFANLFREFYVLQGPKLPTQQGVLVYMGSPTSLGFPDSETSRVRYYFFESPGDDKYLESLTEEEKTERLELKARYKLPSELVSTFTWNENLFENPNSYQTGEFRQKFLEAYRAHVKDIFQTAAAQNIEVLNLVLPSPYHFRRSGGHYGNQFFQIAIQELRRHLESGKEAFKAVTFGYRPAGANIILYRHANIVLDENRFALEHWSGKRFASLYSYHRNWLNYLNVYTRIKNDEPVGGLNEKVEMLVAKTPTVEPISSKFTKARGSYDLAISQRTIPVVLTQEKPTIPLTQILDLTSNDNYTDFKFKLFITKNPGKPILVIIPAGLPAKVESLKHWLSRVFIEKLKAQANLPSQITFLIKGDNAADLKSNYDRFESIFVDQCGRWLPTLAENASETKIRGLLGSKLTSFVNTDVFVSAESQNWTDTDLITLRVDHNTTQDNLVEQMQRHGDAMFRLSFIEDILNDREDRAKIVSNALFTASRKEHPPRLVILDVSDPYSLWASYEDYVKDVLNPDQLWRGTSMIHLSNQLKSSYLLKANFSTEECTLFHDLEAIETNSAAYRIFLILSARLKNDKTQQTALAALFSSELAWEFEKFPNIHFDQIVSNYENWLTTGKSPKAPAPPAEATTLQRPSITYTERPPAIAKETLKVTSQTNTQQISAFIKQNSQPSLQLDSYDQESFLNILFKTLGVIQSQSDHSTVINITISDKVKLNFAKALTPLFMNANNGSLRLNFLSEKLSNSKFSFFSIAERIFILNGVTDLPGAPFEVLTFTTDEFVRSTDPLQIIQKKLRTLDSTRPTLIRLPENLLHFPFDLMKALSMALHKSSEQNLRLFAIDFGKFGEVSPLKSALISRLKHRPRLFQWENARSAHFAKSVSVSFNLVERADLLYKAGFTYGQACWLAISEDSSFKGDYLTLLASLKNEEVSPTFLQDAYNNGQTFHYYDHWFIALDPQQDINKNTHAITFKGISYQDSNETAKHLADQLKYAIRLHKTPKIILPYDIFDLSYDFPKLVLHVLAKTPPLNNMSQWVQYDFGLLKGYTPLSNYVNYTLTLDVPPMSRIQTLPNLTGRNTGLLRTYVTESAKPEFIARVKDYLLRGIPETIALRMAALEFAPRSDVSDTLSALCSRIVSDRILESYKASIRPDARGSTIAKDIAKFFESDSIAKLIDQTSNEKWTNRHQEAPEKPGVWVFNKENYEIMVLENDTKDPTIRTVSLRVYLAPGAGSMVIHAVYQQALGRWNVRGDGKMTLFADALGEKPAGLGSWVSYQELTMKLEEFFKGHIRPLSEMPLTLQLFGDRFHTWSETYQKDLYQPKSARRPGTLDLLGGGSFSDRTKKLSEEGLLNFAYRKTKELAQASFVAAVKKWQSLTRSSDSTPPSPMFEPKTKLKPPQSHSAENSTMSAIDIVETISKSYPSLYKAAIAADVARWRSNVESLRADMKVFLTRFHQTFNREAAKYPRLRSLSKSQIGFLGAAMAVSFVKVYMATGGDFGLAFSVAWDSTVSPEALTKFGLFLLGSAGSQTIVTETSLALAQIKGGFAPLFTGWTLDFMSRIGAFAAVGVSFEHTYLNYQSMKTELGREFRRFNEEWFEKDFKIQGSLELRHFGPVLLPFIDECELEGLPQCAPTRAMSSSPSIHYAPTVTNGIHPMRPALLQSMDVFAANDIHWNSSGIFNDTFLIKLQLQNRNVGEKIVASVKEIELRQVAEKAAILMLASVFSPPIPYAHSVGMILIAGYLESLVSKMHTSRPSQQWLDDQRQHWVEARDNELTKEDLVRQWSSVSGRLTTQRVKDLEISLQRDERFWQKVQEEVTLLEAAVIADLENAMDFMAEWIRRQDFTSEQARPYLQMLYDEVNERKDGIICEVPKVLDQKMRLHSQQHAGKFDTYLATHARGATVGVQMYQAEHSDAAIAEKTSDAVGALGCHIQMLAQLYSYANQWLTGSTDKDAYHLILSLLKKDYEQRVSELRSGKKLIYTKSTVEPLTYVIHDRIKGLERIYNAYAGASADTHAKLLDGVDFVHNLEQRILRKKFFFQPEITPDEIPSLANEYTLVLKGVGYTTHIESIITAGSVKICDTIKTNGVCSPNAQVDEVKVTQDGTTREWKIILHIFPKVSKNTTYKITIRDAHSKQILVNELPFLVEHAG